MDIELVKHIAKLAKLNFEGEELEKFTLQFNQIIEFVEKVNQLPTDKIEPMTSPLQEKVILREDVTGKTLDNATENGPDVRDGLFAVPKVI